MLLLPLIHRQASLSCPAEATAQLDEWEGGKPKTQPVHRPRLEHANPIPLFFDVADVGGDCGARSRQVEKSKNCIWRRPTIWSSLTRLLSLDRS